VDRPSDHRVVSLLFFFSAAMKFVGGAEVKEGMAHLGLPESMVIPLGILEAACTVIYLIRRRRCWARFSSPGTWAARSAPLACR